MRTQAYKDPKDAPSCSVPSGQEAIKAMMQKALDATNDNAMFCYVSTLLCSTYIGLARAGGVVCVTAPERAHNRQFG